MTEKEYNDLIKLLNGVLNTYWPCNVCYWLGYFLAPFTLGMSFYMPNLCISEAKNGLIAAIERQNRLKLKEMGLHLSYVSGWSMAWLELSIVNHVKTAAERDVEPTEDIEAQKT